MRERKPLASINYALVASNALGSLRGAFDVARTVDLAAHARSYRHQPEGDLYRIKLHELKDQDATDYEAKLWLVEQVAWELRDWVEVEDGVARLKQGATADDLRFDGRPILAPEPDLPVTLGHPFSRTHEGGTFAENIRKRIDPKRLDELRESMREFGWIDHHPAVIDEYGVTIVGHRRLLVAKELGIEPKVVRIKFGYGDPADAERSRLALASNLGNDPLNADDRREIAKRFLLEKNQKGEPAWSIRELARLLNVAKETIRKDRKEMEARESAAAEALRLYNEQRAAKLAAEKEEEAAKATPQPLSRHFELMRLAVIAWVDETSERTSRDDALRLRNLVEDALASVDADADHIRRLDVN